MKFVGTEASFKRGQGPRRASKDSAALRSRLQIDPLLLHQKVWKPEAGIEPLRLDSKAESTNPRLRERPRAAS